MHASAKEVGVGAEGELVARCQDAYACIRQHTPAYVSIASIEGIGGREVCHDACQWAFVNTLFASALVSFRRFPHRFFIPSKISIHSSEATNIFFVVRAWIAIKNMLVASGVRSD